MIRQEKRVALLGALSGHSRNRRDGLDPMSPFFGSEPAALLEELPQQGSIALQHTSADAL
jgi:hypothetical protein